MLFTLLIVLCILTTLLLFTALILRLPAFGRNPLGDRLKRVQGSAQYKGDHFENIEKTMLMAEGASYTKMMSEFFKKGIDREPKKKLPFVRTDLHSLENNGFVWFGHSSYLLRVENRNILVDPVFSDRASPIQFVGMRAYEGANTYHPQDMPPLDAIIITHDHYDHLDYQTIKALQRQTKMFYTSIGVGQHLEQWRIPKEKIVEMDWWESLEIFQNATLTAAPARHFSGRGIVRNKTLWSSFVLETPDLKLFIGGDSGYDQSFKKIGDKFGPFDVAIVEAGQYDVKWPQIHMSPEEAVQASLDLRARVLLPVHWGKFTLALHPWNEPIVRVMNEAAKRDVEVATPMIGERVYLKKISSLPQWWNEH
ncbi:MBL fold metallo-hydrolase [Pseudochryseolinea flava]|uniref:MBL fold metallo-hydrolase n=1 Tax=Pseudochryseolinea flava TaxID=2059302 RepID=A0A364XXU1_9BACT|nr:MBL fold metallo-hydrolase [Pseudochryseolinea flava]RAV99101.1 MBL fold metallo-hydrolase [Pseudochryseolinea flava]